ncbi:hypothetical protein NQ315_004579 [Exocentrus adspersus]|uniref:G-protein coupled receptors family 1 profile domain-containing protein n=1 Tax=Exocentrus adspersus TaxID=1586481 RepID=A0AAV8VN21_9CUCU|nr:hypothetical protein NQ315_004579 [Exocentrus adspersus]
MNDSDGNVTYCDLEQFNRNFRSYHITKQMRCPTNFILTSLAVADVLVMLEYIPFAYLHDKSTTSSHYFTYNFAAFIIFHALFTQSFHFISCCITIILAVWRYVAVKFPQNNLKWCSSEKTKATILLTYIFCPFICVPLFLSIDITKLNVFINDHGKIISKPTANQTNLKNTTIYFANYKENTILKDISFYVYGVVIKLVPCILLTVLSVLLIIELLAAKERRKKLLNPTTNNGAVKKKVQQRHLDREKQADRTTKMLLAVLLLFLMVEFPQAIFGLLNHIVGEKFDRECYQPLVYSVSPLYRVESEPELEALVLTYHFLDFLRNSAGFTLVKWIDQVK